MTNAVSKPEPNEALMARQLTEQYTRAIGGLWEIAKFGAMMLKLRDHFLSPRVDSKHEGSGRYPAGEGLKPWIAEHCPSISAPTAFRFMSIADGLKREFQLGVKVDLYALLAGDESDLSDKLLKHRKAIAAFLEGKSQRQLLFRFAMEDVDRGGARDTKSKLTDDEKLKAERESIRRSWNEFAANFRKRGLGKNPTWRVLSRSEIDALQGLLEEGIERIKEFRKEDK